MARGGKRSGAGRRKNQPESAALGNENPRKGLAIFILDSLGVKDWKCPRKCEKSNNGEGTCEVCLRRSSAITHRDSLEKLVDRADGKPVQNVNYSHDKPLEMNVNVKLSEIVRAVRERKREYELNRG